MADPNEVERPTSRRRVREGLEHLVDAIEDLAALHECWSYDLAPDLSQAVAGDAAHSALKFRGTEVLGRFYVARTTVAFIVELAPTKLGL
jgi:hypothetical protein